MSTGPWEGGKGSRPRKYSVSKYQDNYERIFGNAIEERLRQESSAISQDIRDEVELGKSYEQAVTIARSKAKRKK